MFVTRMNFITKRTGTKKWKWRKEESPSHWEHFNIEAETP
jgi:hypothetical protein